MASRRPPTSRSVSNPKAIPPPPRSRSVMSRSAQKNEEAETNIKVVIRCRRRSEREIQDNSPIIVSSSGAKSSQVSIETTAPVSTLGLVTLPPVRTYPFDLVFGPEADQSLVYHEVVSPMLEQVLEGYNCTLFAYGQTGTGKTLTLASKSHTSNYTTKNSEDLLAPELAAPIGSTQPMGMGKDSGKNTDSGLKIYEDSSKRGVFIQGVEEVPVKNCQDALALLTKGGPQTTDCRYKEAGVAGEDLLRIGKFNLVDLAGSENIGRSGAENKRAREAGMINQSLLTLGRVINALVDKSPHVPYRESKLTRLLQDSLGGHTRTCIIATISPARSNLEETLSTLDYAMHAKSIRNKPELNQRMSRNSLLKEYVSEIERLKADLLAAREKNGIFFSEETWAQLSAEQELKQTELEEAKKQVEIVENQMRNVREEFEQSIGLLMKRDTELKETKAKLKNTEEELAETGVELKGVKVAFEEEVVVRQAFQKSEGTLDAVATDLKSVAHNSIQDVAGLFDKIQRKSHVLDSNSKAVVVHGKTIISAIELLSLKLNDFADSCSDRVRKLRQSTQQFETKELETLAACTTRVQKQLQDVQTSLQTIRTHDTAEAEALDNVQALIKETYSAFHTDFGRWGEATKKTNTQVHQQLETVLSGAFVDFEATLKSIQSLLETVLVGAMKFVEAERESILHAHSIANDAAQAEISRLREQNELLLHLVEQQKSDAAKSKDVLIGQISGLLGEYVDSRDRDLREALAPITHSNEAAAESMRAFSDQHKGITTGMKGEGTKIAKVLEKANEQSKTMADDSVKKIQSNHSSVKVTLSSAKRKLSEAVESHSQDVQERAQALSTSSTEAFTRYARAKRSRLDDTQGMAANLHTESKSLHRGLATLSKDVKAYSEQTTSYVNGFTDLTEQYRNVAEENISSVQAASSSLAREATTEDVPTGNTPRKRTWKYVDKWDLTKSRDVLLKEWRSQGASSISSETFLGEHVPLPEDDAESVQEEDTTMQAPVSKATSCQPTPEPSPREPSFPGSLQNSVSSASTSPPSPPIPPIQLPTRTAKQMSKVTTRLPPLADTRNTYATRSRRNPR
ncbi:Kinesin-related motor protein [Paramarasmius palmivorus]|uniref:Kinesin-related motor protein n=1 Tax=Paramarasmius palmivorus TaxID=297713 RepID=A0AAW0DU41_9AGAR